jgi:uncharacterized Fe-S cluster-containing radical SAM superfamily protein
MSGCLFCADLSANFARDAGCVLVCNGCFHWSSAAERCRAWKLWLEQANIMRIRMMSIHEGFVKFEVELTNDSVRSCLIGTHAIHDLVEW